MRPIIRLQELSLQTQSHGESFEARIAAVAAPLGALRLGARYVEVPPGKKAWPHHCHHANDELFVILGGRGVLRYGKQRHPVQSGDVVVCPAGGEETAHQLIAEGDEPLRYLAVGSMHEPDVLEYPDSGKVAVFVGSAPGGDKAARRLELTVKKAGAVDYWDGEP
ncbi:cupin domain-containing protein [Rhodopseudomonas sp. WA056]|uniref:cupin domain-containing protein n=1 Tax=Rhodopseudomonas sp. WA056 TaxID=2269367 RepID=UPI0013DEA8A7|nr:cupin domain-containing protein [Rhodopseudomonas sp. WA056]NEW87409.1 cupin domain-containing protein [Rhodopseudomonas sp. WA056]